MTKLKRSECAVLILVLKRKWFDMIASGEKGEEYREATKYWGTRLWNWDRRPEPTPVVEFRLGYAKDAPRMAFWCLGCPTASGMMSFAFVDTQRHPEWGEPSSPHYVIRLGERVELEGKARNG